MALVMAVSLFPTTVQATPEYSSWNGCWLSDFDLDCFKNHDGAEKEYYIDFDSLSISEYSIKYGVLGKAYGSVSEPYSMTKVNDKTFTYATKYQEFTLVLKDDGTISYTAPSTDTLNAKNDTLRKDNTFLDKFNKLISSSSSGLNSFTSSNTYNNSFKDVEQNTWYEDSIKCVFEYGVMDGIGNKQFDPDGVVSLAQVITVASRMHAQYYSKTVLDTGSNWYDKYISYASSNGLLPDDFSTDLNLDSPATREFMAYVFSNAIAEQDLPAVNLGAEIPDIDTVSKTYTESAKLMYNSGIMTGQANNYFNPRSQATRAQMATIIMRLLQPIERLTSDPKLDPDFLANESNIMNQVPVFMGNDGNYLAFTYTGSQSSRNNSNYKAYLKYNENVQTFSGQNWTNLVCADGYYYYTYSTYGANGRIAVTLVKQSVSGGNSQVIYKTTDGNNDITAVTVYDGTVYFLQTGSNYSEESGTDYYTELYRIDNNGKAEFLTTLPGLGNRIAAFNGSIYFNVHSDVVSYNLVSGETKDLISYVSDWTMSAGTIFYLEYGGNVNKIMAELPDTPKALSTLPNQAYNGTINYRNGVLYVYPNYREGILYTCDDTGLHPLYNLGNQAIYRLGIFDFGFYYEDNNDSEAYAIWKGKIATEDNGEITRNTLYDHFK